MKKHVVDLKYIFWTFKHVFNFQSTYGLQISFNFCQLPNFSNKNKINKTSIRRFDPIAKKWVGIIYKLQRNC